MFGSDEQGASAGGRYRVRLVSGQMRQKSHQQSVQETLDEGSAQGWRLVDATTTYGSGGWLTSIFWDTAPDR